MAGLPAAAAADRLSDAFQRVVVDLQLPRQLGATVRSGRSPIHSLASARSANSSHLRDSCLRQCYLAVNAISRPIELPGHLHRTLTQ